MVNNTVGTLVHCSQRFVCDLSGHFIRYFLRNNTQQTWMAATTTLKSYNSQELFSSHPHSVLLLPKTADILRTIPRRPTAFLVALRVSRTMSRSSWKTTQVPWYVSAAEISKKPELVERARSRPSSLEIVLRCCRSRLFPTKSMGTFWAPPFLLNCWIRWSSWRAK